jgi:hypothetical protein
MVFQKCEKVDEKLIENESDQTVKTSLFEVFDLCGGLQKKYGKK